MRLEELCHLIEVSSRKRFRMAKAQELQELARNSFGFAMAGNVFSTMIQLCARQLDFLKQQVREMDRKIAEIMEALDTPITTITGIGPTLGAYILSEIGDINRFSSSAKLANYVGIAFPVSGSCPTVYLPSHRPSFRIKTLRLRRYIHQSY